MKDVPLHRSMEKPRKLPRKIWSRMTDEQKLDYLAYVRLYLDELDNEKRAEFLKRKGY